jgi:hypothetical protein
MPRLDPRIPLGSGGCGGARITSGPGEDEKIVPRPRTILMQLQVCPQGTFEDIVANALPTQLPRHFIDPVHRQREHPALHQVVHHTD